MKRVNKLLSVLAAGVLFAGALAGMLSGGGMVVKYADGFSYQIVGKHLLV